MVNKIKYPEIINLLGNRIMYDSKKSITGYIQVTKNNLVFVKYSDKEPIFSPYNKELSNQLTLYSYLKSEKINKEINFVDGDKYISIEKSNINGDIEFEINYKNRIINIQKNKINIFEDYEKKKILIISSIDNLIKGASGQAIQNMNLMFGFNEKESLI